MIRLKRAGSFHIRSYPLDPPNPRSITLSKWLAGSICDGSYFKNFVSNALGSRSLI